MNVTAVDFVTRNAASPRTNAPAAAVAVASTFTAADAQALLASKFAPWVSDLGLVVESCSPSEVRLRLPYSPRLARVGDTVCGQALMACADSAIGIAIWAAFGSFRNVTTVNQAMSFMRAMARSDVLLEAKVQKLGRSLIFGECTFKAAGSPDTAAHATATWAVIP